MSEPYKIFNPNVMDTVEQLERRAKGYTGQFRHLLEDAAYIIAEYQKEQPFADCVKEHAFAFAWIAFERAIEIAEKQGADDVAQAIRDEAGKVKE